jgi:hypothetical protein
VEKDREDKKTRVDREREDALDPMLEIPVWIVQGPHRKGGPLPLSRAREADNPTPYPALRLRVYLERNRIHRLQDDIAAHIGHRKGDLEWSMVKWRRHTAHQSAYRLVGESENEWVHTMDIWRKNIKKWKAITLLVTSPASEEHPLVTTQDAHEANPNGFGELPLSLSICYN